MLLHARWSTNHREPPQPLSFDDLRAHLAAQAPTEIPNWFQPARVLPVNDPRDPASRSARRAGADAKPVTRRAFRASQCAPHALELACRSASIPVGGFLWERGPRRGPLLAYACVESRPGHHTGAKECLP